jgi:hypothetical protein
MVRMFRLGRNFLQTVVFTLIGDNDLARDIEPLTNFGL